jgi:glucose/arabinose dehydrogenase
VLARRGSGLVLAAALAVVLALAAAPARAAISMPPGFEEVTLADGFAAPGGTGVVDAAWAPDGRLFVADEAGIVYVHDPGTPAAQNHVLLDISQHVNDAAGAQRGLLGIATDTDFASNGFLYLLYTYDDGSDDSSWKVSTLTRVTVHPDDSVDGGPTSPTEAPILGEVPTSFGNDPNVGVCGAPSNTNQCIPSEGVSHSIGTVRSAPDGTLFVGTGDGSNFLIVDPLSLYADDPTTYRGKIMHIDREGHGLPGHQFCAGDNDLTHVCTKIYASGLRNPFRFTLRPSGGLAIGDVGQNAYEEIDFANGGENFGWPCREGFVATPFQNAGQTYGSKYQQCADVDANNTTAPPLLVAAHNYTACDASLPTGNTIVGGPIYEGDQYPAGYRGQLFFGDVGFGSPPGCDWLARVNIVGDRSLTDYQPFATGWPQGVDLEAAPDGNLAYVSLGENAVREIVYGPGNHRPSVSPSATPAKGPAPLGVTFHAGGSDPDGDALSYDWDLGDSSPHLSGDTPGHFYTKPGHYTATVTVDDGRGMSAGASLPVTVTAAPKTPVRLRGLRLSARGARHGVLSGSFSSPDSIRSLRVSLWRGRAFARSCRWWSRRAHGLRRGSCKQPHWLTARLHRKGQRYSWKLTLGRRIRKDTYTLLLQALPRGSTHAPSARMSKRFRVRR